MFVRLRVVSRRSGFAFGAFDDAGGGGGCGIESVHVVLCGAGGANGHSFCVLGGKGKVC